MGEPDMRTVRAVMKAIFGTDTSCERKAERNATDEMLSRVEEKMARLDKALDERPAHNLDEAIRQIVRER